MTVPQNSHEGTSSSRSVSRDQRRVQGDLNERRRIGCLGSSMDRTFRPRGASVLGPPSVICADDESGSVGGRRRDESSFTCNDDGRATSRTGGRSISRGENVSRGRVGRDPSQSRARSKSRDGRSMQGARSKSRGPEKGTMSQSRNGMKRAESIGGNTDYTKRSQSRQRTIDAHLSSGNRSKSRGRRDSQTISSKKSTVSGRSKSRGRRNDENETVKSTKSSRSQSRDKRGGELHKSKSSRSQSRGRDASTVITSKSSKSVYKSSSNTVASSSSGWKRFVDHTGFSNLTHYSGSSGKFSGGTEETSPLSLYKDEPAGDREPLDRKKKDRKASQAAMPPTGDVHKSTTYSPDSESIVTNLYDRTGHCVRHPHVRLRKKKLWGGGWNIIIANCPDCCLEEMGRLVKLQKKKESGDDGAARQEVQNKEKKRGDSRPKDRRSSQSVHPSSSHDFHEARSVRSTKSSRMYTHTAPLHQSFEGSQNAPIFEFDIPLEEQPGHHPESFTSPKSVKSKKSSAKSVKSSSKSVKSSKSAKTNKSGRTERSGKSTRTSRTAKSSSKGGKDSSKSSKSKREDDHEEEDESERRSGTLSHPPLTPAAACVANMPFTDQYGCPGKYSGEVNSFGQPHGKGVLRYDDGGVNEGIWVKGQCDADERDCGRSVSHKSTAKSVSGRSVSNRSSSKSVSGRSVSNRSVSSRSRRSISKSPGRNPLPYQQQQPHPYHQQQNSPQQSGYVTKMPWSDVNGFSGHYTGEVNHNDAPEGKGYMEYSNGVVEDGMWCNGVFQPPLNFHPPSYQDGSNVPSSSMSVWSLRSTPNMVNNNYDGSRGGRGGSVYSGMRY